MIQITSITIVNTGGADKIFFHTTLPNPIWPFTGTATLSMESAQSETDKFLSDNFPDIPVKIIRT